MGSAESALLVAWVVWAGATQEIAHWPPQPKALRSYGLLVCVDAAHAFAFFATLGEHGAVSAALLKGAQLILVYATGSVLFCDPVSRAGCATPCKTAAVASVALALALFYYAKASTGATSPRQPGSDPKSPKLPRDRGILTTL